MVEGEFDFWVPGNLLYCHERREDTRLDDTFPLLSSDRGCSSNLSPTSRLRRIEEGRKELMEMICDMPESCYELSLKDMVVNQNHKAGGPASSPAGTEAQVYDKQRKNKKRRMKDGGVRPCHVTRSSSMETGPFLIRMFFPAFMARGKKPASGYRSKAPLSSPTPRASLDWSGQGEVNKDSMKVGRLPFPRDEWSPERTSRSKSCASRIEHGGFLSWCWPFGGSNTNNTKGKVIKGKMIRQKTCVF